MAIAKPTSSERVSPDLSIHQRWYRTRSDVVSRTRRICTGMKTTYPLATNATRRKLFRRDGPEAASAANERSADELEHDPAALGLDHVAEIVRVELDRHGHRPAVVGDHGEHAVALAFMPDDVPFRERLRWVSELSGPVREANNE